MTLANADSGKTRIGIVVSKVYPEITEEMLKISLARAKEKKAEVKFVLHIGGSFDTPLAVKRLLERTDIDGVVVLGSVIKGETGHDEIVAGNAARKIADLSVQYSKPVGLGISGPGMTRKQAVQRIEKFASDSVDAVLDALEEFKKLEAD
ncbi:MAG: 6,7-dimethyl-8-ribityllumazine synthase [Candidatus Diapherotrites archaeon]|nr:6,7-dimethyl-8-ribityllumazine synthase [Candidatus Diapherotrites archaeon]